MTEVPLGAQRLLKLAAVLENLPPQSRYNHHTWAIRDECGTTCCAIGWGGTLLVEELGFGFAWAGRSGWFYETATGKGHRVDAIDAASTAFEISRDLAYKLFGGGSYVNEEDLLYIPEATDVARELRSIAACKIDVANQDKT